MPNISTFALCEVWRQSVFEKMAENFYNNGKKMLVVPHRFETRLQELSLLLREKQPNGRFEVQSLFERCLRAGLCDMQCGNYFVDTAFWMHPTEFPTCKEGFSNIRRSGNWHFMFAQPLDVASERTIIRGMVAALGHIRATPANCNGGPADTSAERLILSAEHIREIMRFADRWRMEPQQALAVVLDTGIHTVLDAHAPLLG